jgi:hypothetical protein
MGTKSALRLHLVSVADLNSGAYKKLQAISRKLPEPKGG